MGIRPPLRALACVALAAAALAASTGCSSVGGSAIRTGPHVPPYSGPVAVFAGGMRPQGRDLGLVEVHASQSEGTLETLFPLFVKKVASIGGDAAVIDGVRASFQIVTRSRAESYSFGCGYNAVCVGTRSTPAADEVMTVTMYGRAVAMREPAPTNAAPKEAPAAAPKGAPKDAPTETPAEEGAP